MCKIVVLCKSHRTLNNIASAMSKLVQRGAQCDLLWAPYPEAVDESGRIAIGFPVRDLSPISGDPNRHDIFCREASRFLAQQQPDLVIADDIGDWRSRALYAVVRAVSNRPWQLAWQHGLHNRWYEVRRCFPADFFLCYGRMQPLILGPRLYGRTLPVGLPKLDRLAGERRTLDGYLVWFAQPQPSATFQIGFLAEVAQSTGSRVLVRPHPSAPNAFERERDLDGLGLEIDESRDPVETIRACNGFLSTHSSAALEAILLDKPTVLFPSYGLTAFAGYPNIASEFKAAAYLHVMKQYDSRRDEVEAFLEDSIGGRRFDHTDRSVRVIEAIHELRRSGVDPGAAQWWRGDTALRREMAGQHPALDSFCIA